MHGIYSVQKVVHSEEARNKKKQVEEKQDEEKKEEYVKDTEMNKQKNLLSVLQYYEKKGCRNSFNEFRKKCLQYKWISRNAFAEYIACGNWLSFNQLRIRAKMGEKEKKIRKEDVKRRNKVEEETKDEEKVAE